MFALGLSDLHSALLPNVIDTGQNLMMLLEKFQGCHFFSRHDVHIAPCMRNTTHFSEEPSSSQYLIGGANLLLLCRTG